MCGKLSTFLHYLESHDDAIGKILETEFYTFFSFGFLSHESVSVRKIILTAMSSFMRYSKRSDFLKEKELIEKLLKMIKRDEFDVKMLATGALMNFPKD